MHPARPKAAPNVRRGEFAIVYPYARTRIRTHEVRKARNGESAASVLAFVPLGSEMIEPSKLGSLGL